MMLYPTHTHTHTHIHPYTKHLPCQNTVISVNSRGKSSTFANTSFNTGVNLVPKGGARPTPCGEFDDKLEVDRVGIDKVNHMLAFVGLCIRRRRFR
jgi:hypothetical protein